jgi:hypothetical protein
MIFVLAAMDAMVFAGLAASPPYITALRSSRRALQRRRFCGAMGNGSAVGEQNWGQCK